jgi:hypothetical protein
MLDAPSGSLVDRDAAISRHPDRQLLDDIHPLTVLPKPLLSYKRPSGILFRMELNPYAKFLAGRDPIEIIGSTFAKLSKLSDRLPDDRLTLRVPLGRWNAREIVAHLADCELVFSFRLRQTLAEDHPVLQPFDQDRWAARYAKYDMDSALRLFSAARNWNLLLIDGVSETERARPVSHPERGTMTFWTIVETIAGHDLNHLQQIERLCGPAGPPGSIE